MISSVDVRIVSEPWTSDVFALLAIAISLATLAWTLWVRRRDQARVDITSAISIPVGTPGPAERLIGITVTNVGRTGSTVLKSIHLQEGRRGGNLWVTRPAHGVAPAYPLTLEPGASTDLLVDPWSVARGCADNDIDPGSLRVVATTGHGRTTARLRKNCQWLVRDVGAS